MDLGVDSVSLLSSVVSATQSAATNERQIAIAANAIKTEQATVATLMEAIQQSAAYGASGQPSAGAVTGTRFAASA